MDVYEVDYIKIGRRIRAARTKLGWQQAEVAFRAGLTTSHMSHNRNRTNEVGSTDYR